MTDTPLPRSKKLIFSAVTVAFLVVVVELLSYALIAIAPTWYSMPILRTRERKEGQAVALRHMFEPSESSTAEFSPELGWTLKPGARSPAGHINSRGLRSLREYDETAPEGVLRVAAFGDSFTYGTGVGDAENWAAQVEALAPDVEVLNYGVPGYGTDQAVLRYRSSGGAMGARVVVLGIHPVSATRVVSVVVGFRTPTPYAFSKPRFVVNEGGMELLANPVKSFEDAKPYLEDPSRIIELAAHDYWYDPMIFENPLYDYWASMRIGVALWTKVKTRFLDDRRPLVGPPRYPLLNTKSEAFAVLDGVVTAFAAEVRASGAAPLVVFYPDNSSLEGHAQGLKTTHAPLVDRCVEANIPYADTTALIAGFDRRRVWLPDDHYTAEVNAEIAKWILPKLREHAAGR